MFLCFWMRLMFDGLSVKQITFHNGVGFIQSVEELNRTKTNFP